MVCTIVLAFFANDAIFQSVGLSSRVIQSDLIALYKCTIRKVWINTFESKVQKRKTIALRKWSD